MESSRHAVVGSSLETIQLERAARFNRSQSIAMDILRGTAALVVFLHHVNIYHLDRGWLDWLRPDIGHSAVVVFFVLSGYVIAASAARSRSARRFAIKRFARIYSVAIPAVLLAYGLAALSHGLGLPAFAPEYQLAKPLVYIGVGLTFIGQLWGLGEPVFSNDPYWSLHYEAWYYVLFGAAVFARGAWRYVAVGAVLAAMGPKLWALFPIWLGGAWVFWLRRYPAPSVGASRVLVVVAAAALVGLKLANVEDPVNAAVLGVLQPWLRWPLHHSSGPLGDLLVGLPTMLLVYAVGPARLVFPRVVVVPGRFLAEVSYSLYLTHLPLLLFFGVLLPSRPLAAVLAGFGCSVGFGLIFERQKEALARLCEWVLPVRVPSQA